VDAQNCPLTHDVTASLDGGVTVTARYAHNDDGLWLVSLELLADDATAIPITSEHLRAIPLNRLSASAWLEHFKTPPWARYVRVSRPDGTDDWYRSFAEKFLMAAALSSAPATYLAGTSDVPVSAVHRWTREARRRGFLPPDPRGPRDL